MTDLMSNNKTLTEPGARTTGSKFAVGNCLRVHGPIGLNGLTAGDYAVSAVGIWYNNPTVTFRRLGDGPLAGREAVYFAQTVNPLVRPEAAEQGRIEILPTSP